jgi:hypothetical protein
LKLKLYNCFLGLYREFKISYANGNKKLKSIDACNGHIRYSKMQLDVLALQESPEMRFTHAFIVIGDQYIYDQLYTIIRCRCPNFDGLHKICVLIRLDGDEHVIKRGDSLDAQTKFKMKR